jgi:hypothetical protein
VRDFWNLIIRNLKNKRGDTLYVHYPCFDGLISGVLAWEFLETQQHWTIRDVRPINYNVRDQWLSMSLGPRTAVVDFLYHPKAAFWVDHHLTSFVSGDAKSDFEHRKGFLPLLYDSHSGSSALLLWNRFARAMNYPDRYREMVDWAEKIDSAAYSSVYEAVLGDAPALRINFSLMSRDAHTKAFCDYLMRQLRNRSLAEVAELPDIKTKYERVRELVERGLDHLRGRLTLLSNIVAFDVEASDDAMISRYAPYYFVPNADYSIGITRYPHGAKITSMRNPWRNFESIPLGTIFARYGGGGHQRVASVFLSEDRANNVEAIADDILRDIRAYQAELSVAAPEAALA